MIKLIPIKPKTDPINYPAVERAVRETMRSLAEEAKQDMEATTRGWKHDATFHAIADRTGYIIGTDDEVWNWLDQGTRPHVIRPRRARRLRFVTSGRVVWARQVNHPGTKPRAWSKMIKHKYQREMPHRMNEAIGSAIGGH